MDGGGLLKEFLEEAWSIPLLSLVFIPALFAFSLSSVFHLSGLHEILLGDSSWGALILSISASKQPSFFKCILQVVESPLGQTIDKKF